MMTRKDYIALSEAIIPCKLEMGASDYELLVDRLTEFLKSDNPRFDVDRWEAACGLRIMTVLPNGKVVVLDR